MNCTNDRAEEKARKTMWPPTRQVALLMGFGLWTGVVVGVGAAPAGALPTIPSVPPTPPRPLPTSPRPVPRTSGTASPPDAGKEAAPLAVHPAPKGGGPPKDVVQPDRNVFLGPEGSTVVPNGPNRPTQPFEWSNEEYERHKQEFRWSEYPGTRPEDSPAKPGRSKTKPQTSGLQGRTHHVASQLPGRPNQRLQTPDESSKKHEIVSEKVRSEPKPPVEKQEVGSSTEEEPHLQPPRRMSSHSRAEAGSPDSEGGEPERFGPKSRSSGSWDKEERSHPHASSQNPRPTPLLKDDTASSAAGRPQVAESSVPSDPPAGDTAEAEDGSDFAVGTTTPLGPQEVRPPRGRVGMPTTTPSGSSPSSPDERESRWNEPQPESTTKASFTKRTQPLRPRLPSPAGDGGSAHEPPEEPSIAMHDTVPLRDGPRGTDRRRPPQEGHNGGADEGDRENGLFGPRPLAGSFAEMFPFLANVLGKGSTPEDTGRTPGQLGTFSGSRRRRPAAGTERRGGARLHVRPLLRAPFPSLQAPREAEAIRRRVRVEPPPSGSAARQQRGEDCGLLRHLQGLLGRELSEDQFGMRVYTSVVESILATECGRPGWRRDVLRPALYATTPKPLPAPVTGMEGWLTLDDLQKQEEASRRQEGAEGHPRSSRASHAPDLTPNQELPNSSRLASQSSSSSSSSTPASTIWSSPASTSTSAPSPSPSLHLVSPAGSVPRRHWVRVRRAVASSSSGREAATMGLLGPHHLALATASAEPSSEAAPLPAGQSSRALSSTVFGFETVLTGLVYLSFGIFLYQMIQKAVEARTAASSASGGRSAPGPHLPALLRSLQEVPDVAAEAMLMAVKGSEVSAKRRRCLPFYFCLQHHHRRSDDDDDDGFVPRNGAQSLSCDQARRACLNHLTESSLSQEPSYKRGRISSS